MSTMQTGNEHVRLTIDGHAHEVLQLQGRESLSTPFRYCIECVGTASDSPPETLIGRDAHIVLDDGSGVTRTIVGIVTTVSSRVYDEERALVCVVVEPPMAALAVGRDCRVFHDMSVVDVVADVLARAGIEARWTIGREYAEQAYIAQYRESDLQLIDRLLERDGIYYWFDHCGARSGVVFSDDSTASPPLTGGESIPFEADSGLVGDGEQVFELGPRHELTADRFVVRSFDPNRPALTVEGVAGDGKREIYDARGAGPVSPDEARLRARTRQQSAESRRATVTGATNSVRLYPGRRVAIAGHLHQRLDAAYVVTSSTVTVRQRQHGTSGRESRPPETRFDAVPARAPFKTPLRTPVPRQPGLQVGVVVGPDGEEVYPDDEGRVRVQFHWDREGDRSARSGRWMRVNQRGTAGSLMLPRIGWNVFTMSEEGSVDLPIVLHRFFDAEHPPPYSLPANKTRTVFRTATTPSKALARGSASTNLGLGLSFPNPDPSGGFGFNEIRLEDRAGHEEMFWNASRDLSVLVQNDKIERIQVDHTHQVVVDHALDVGNDSAETIVTNQTIHVMGNETETVGGGRAKHVNGDERIEIAGSRKISTGGGLSTHVLGTRKLSVGPALIDVSLGDIVSTAPSVHTLVGGAAIKLTASSMTETVGKSIAFGGISGPSVGGVVQTIGGLKLEVSRSHRAINAHRNYVENVGGMLLHLAQTEIEDAGRLFQKVSVGGALTALSFGEIGFEGKKRVVFTCGGSQIVIEGDNIMITSGKVSISGGGLQSATAGGNVLHNS